MLWSKSPFGSDGSSGRITALRFNQDASLVATARTDGFRIYNVNPLIELAHYDADGLVDGDRIAAEDDRVVKQVSDQVGSVATVELLGRSNAIAMVATSPSSARANFDVRPKFADNVVVVIDNDSRRVSFTITLSNKVLAVRFRRDKIVAICETEVHVFSFPLKPKHLFSMATRPNPRGLCEISPVRGVAKRDFVIFPGSRSGSFHILDLSVTTDNVSSAPVCVNAHKSELACLAVNQQATMIGSGSEKGTLIRVWDVETRAMLVELRRGVDSALIYCINFSPCNQWLCCSSDKGTVHIFALQDYSLNRRSALAATVVGGLVSSSGGVASAYAGSQWSLASFSVSEDEPCICAFGPWDADAAAGWSHGAKGIGSIYAFCTNGTFRKFHFTADGQTKAAAYEIFTQMCRNCIWDKLRKVPTNGPSC